VAFDGLDFGVPKNRGRTGNASWRRQASMFYARPAGIPAWRRPASMAAASKSRPCAFKWSHRTACPRPGCQRPTRRSKLSLPAAVARLRQRSNCP
jgi:hypothetical protein